MKYSILRNYWEVIWSLKYKKGDTIKNHQFDGGLVCYL